MAKREYSIFRSMAIVSACTGMSRILGLVREVLMAYFFGTTLAKSAFDIAFLVPNLFRRLLGEGALSAAFVPVFAESLERQGLQEANRLVGRMLSLLSFVLIAVVSCGVVIITLTLHGLPLNEKTAVVLPLMRIMLPYMFFICTAALCMAILNSLHHFAVPAFSPVLLNTVWILGLVFICPHLGSTPRERIVAVAWAVLAAGALQLLVHLPALRRHGINPEFSWAWRDEQVRQVLMLMGPAAVGMGLLQVNTVIDRVLAFWAGPWGPAALGYAERLIYLPLGLFGTALGTVLLPTFSRQVARAENGRMLATLGTSMRGLMLIVMPAAVGLAVLAHPIVSLFFEWKGGVFNDESAVLTARAVVCYAPGLFVFSLEKILVPAFYAMKDTRTPVKIGVFATFLNLFLNILFVLTWPAGYKHAGLAFATVLVHSVSCVALAWIMHKRIGSPGWRTILKSWSRTLLAALAMGTVISYAYVPIVNRLYAAVGHAKVADILAVLLTVVAGMACYGLFSRLLCSQEWALLKRRGSRGR